MYNYGWIGHKPNISVDSYRLYTRIREFRGSWGATPATFDLFPLDPLVFPGGCYLFLVHSLRATIANPRPGTFPRHPSNHLLSVDHLIKIIHSVKTLLKGWTADGMAMTIAAEKETFMYPSGMRGEQMLCAIGPDNLLMWTSTPERTSPYLLQPYI
jgi:hypothetical protein